MIPEPTPQRSAEVPQPILGPQTGMQPVVHAAHDIGNVLAALKLRMTMLMRDEQCRLAQSHNLEAMQRIIDHGSAITTSLVRRSARRADRPRTNLADAISDAIEIAANTMDGMGSPVRFVTDLPPLPLVVGGRDYVTRVFANLFVNARDAMPGGGAVTITAHVAGDVVVVAVEDDGPGIPSAVAERVFQATFTTKPDGDGGLGLAIVAEVMERIGGSVELLVRPGCGARFELRFAHHR